MFKKCIKISIASGLILTLVAGCQSSHKDDQMAAKQRWKAASSQVKLKLANQKLENGQYNKALSMAADQLSATDKPSDAYMIIGKANLAKGELGKASLAFEKCAQQGEDPEAWYLLGTVYREKGDITRASECMAKAVESDPTNAEYNLAIARCYSYTGKNEEAIDILLKQIDNNPNDAVLTVEAADLLCYSGQTQKAISLYKRALILNPDDAKVTESLGYCYLELQKWSKAAKIFCTLLHNSDSNNSSKYLRILATCYMNSKEYGWACNYYDKLSALDRNDPKIWLQMGQAALGAGYPERALECACRALSLRPNWSDAEVLKGCALYMDKKYSSAVESFVKSAADTKIKGFSWLMIGRCYELMGRHDVAKKAYQNAIGFNANNKLVTLLTGK